MSVIPDGVRIGKKKTSRLGPSPRSSLAILDFVPATLDRDGICVAQVRTGAGDLTINGAFATAGMATLDAGVKSYGRCVGIYSGGNLSALTFTVYGYDAQRRPVREAIAGPNNTTTAGVKSFKTITRVAVSATIGTNVEVGTIDKFGLPMYLASLSQVVHVGYGETLARDAATFAIGVTTSPATATTGDTRGTVIPSAVTNGSKRLVVVMVPDMTSDASQFGVQQYAVGV